MTFGALVAYFFNVRNGVQLIPAAIFAIAIAGAAGGLLDFGLWRPLRRRGTGLIAMLIVSIGLSLLLSSLFVYYRDVGHIWEICTLVLFYGSAIVYPFVLFQQHHVAVIAGLNPLAQIVEDLRHALVTPGAPWTMTLLGGLYAVPVLLSVGVFVLGFYVFHRLTPRFAENL